jgi:hypothetical protein
MTKLHTEISRLVRKDDLFACAKRLRMLEKQDGKKVIHFEHEFEMDMGTSGSCGGMFTSLNRP